jgi:uncharacterized protein YigA (DUF484 family)
MTQPPDAESVAQYLQQHPDFFDQHPEIVATLRLTTALGGRTVSLQERQVEILRDKIRQLELNASGNELIMANLHQWTLQLIANAAPSDLPSVVVNATQSCFDVPQVTIRLWHTATEFSEEDFVVNDEDARAFADTHDAPVCGAAAGQPGTLWLDDAASMQSVALVPLRKSGAESSFGLLVLGSPDPQRFAADLATDILTRIGEIASARLQPLLD